MSRSASGSRMCVWEVTMRCWLRHVACTLFMAAIVVSDAAAQSVARTFEELAMLVEPGDYVFVIDRGDRETWGRVTDVSAASLTLVVVLKHEGGARLEVTSDTRVFSNDTIGLLLRSDASGRRGAAIYPASWAKVDALASGEDVTVFLGSGERRRYRLAQSDADSLRGFAPSGHQEAVERRQIVRVERNGVDDPSIDGTILGALIGAGTGLGLMTVAYATACATCDAPEPGPMFLAAGSFGAGVGAFTGWLIDNLHKGKEVVYPAVSPILTRQRQGVSVSLRF
jgi:hypothetical protein